MRAIARARDENRLDRRFAPTRDYLARKAEMIADRCPRRKDPHHECVPECQAHLSPEHLDVIDDFAFIVEVVRLGKAAALRDGVVLADGELATVLRKNGLATYMRTKSQLRADLRTLDQAVSDDLTYCSACNLGPRGAQEYIAHRAVCPAASSDNGNGHAATSPEDDAATSTDAEGTDDERDDPGDTQETEGAA